MKLVTLAFIIAVAQFAVAADRDTDTQKKDAEARKKLVGIWKGRVIDGAKGHELTITTTLITATRNKKQDLGKGTFKLDLTKKPWRMDATKSSKRGRKKKTYLGIYSLEGDTLKWCVSTPGNERPTKFATEGSQFLLVLKRQKKEKT